jgi:hypothetical protein
MPMKHISRMEEIRDEYKILIRNRQRKTLSLRVWEDNIRIDFGKTRCYSSNDDRLSGYLIIELLLLLILISKICMALSFFIFSIMTVLCRIYVRKINFTFINYKRAEIWKLSFELFRVSTESQLTLR